MNKQDCHCLHYDDSKWPVVYQDKHVEIRQISRGRSVVKFLKDR